MATVSRRGASFWWSGLSLAAPRLSSFFFFSSRRRHTRYWRDWSSDVCSSDLPLPVSALRYAGRTPVSVLPSPVRISAMLPRCSAAPPMSCTRKCRWPRVRVAASRTTAKASGRRWSRVSPSSRRSLNSSVLARSSASVRSAVSSASDSTASAILFSRRRILPSPARRIFENTTGPGYAVSGAGSGHLTISPVAHDLDDPPAALLALLTARRLARLTTLRAASGPHVVPVGGTYDAATRTARVITPGRSAKARHVRGGRSRVAVCQVDGRRWVTLEGTAVVRDEPAAVADAEARYARRYRTPRENPARVVLEISVDRVLGNP